MGQILGQKLVNGLGQASIYNSQCIKLNEKIIIVYCYSWDKYNIRLMEQFEMRAGFEL